MKTKRKEKDESGQVLRDWLLVLGVMFGSLALMHAGNATLNWTFSTPVSGDKSLAIWVEDYYPTSGSVLSSNYNATAWLDGETDASISVSFSYDSGVDGGVRVYWKFNGGAQYSDVMLCSSNNGFVSWVNNRVDSSNSITEICNDDPATSYTNTFYMTNSTVAWQEWTLSVDGGTNGVTEYTFYLEPGETGEYYLEEDYPFDYSVWSSELNLGSDLPTLTTNQTGSGVSGYEAGTSTFDETNGDPDIYANVQLPFGTQNDPSVVDGSRASAGTNEFTQLTTIESNNENRHDDLKDLLVALDGNQRRRDELGLLSEQNNFSRLINALDGGIANASTNFSTNGFLPSMQVTNNFTNNFGTGTGGLISTNGWTVSSNTPSFTIPFSELNPELTDWEFDFGDTNLQTPVGYIRAFLLTLVSIWWLRACIRLASQTIGLGSK